MKKALKASLKTILGTVCFASVILAGAENLDGSVNFAWTGGFIFLAFVSGVGYDYIRKNF